MINGQIGARLTSFVTVTMTTTPMPTAGQKLPLALWIAAAIVLVVAVFQLPYGYYTFTRIAPCLACGILRRSASHHALGLFGGPFCPRRELSHHVIEQRLAVFHVGFL
jgi:hypothetical protein